MKIVALVVEVFEFHFIENRAVDEFFGAEPVINHDAAPEIFHARLHRAALVAGSTVIDAENGEKLALVLNDHAGAELCGFNAAHKLPERLQISEIPAGSPLCDAVHAE